MKIEILKVENGKIVEPEDMVACVMGGCGGGYGDCIGYGNCPTVGDRCDRPEGIPCAFGLVDP